VSPPSRWKWTIDSAIPTASITSGPANPTMKADATFVFSSAVSGATFTCALDKAPAEPCSSGKAYLHLADGAHTFTLRPISPVGRAGALVNWTWTIDTTPVTVTIASGPANLTRSSSATFAFAGSKVKVTFICSLDQGPPGPCVSGQTYTNIPDGAHSLTVSATDAAGNVGQPSNWIWTIDTVPPIVTIARGPANPTNNPVATFAFSSDEQGSTFVCTVDKLPQPCLGGQFLTKLPDGSHLFTVSAMDPAGNVGRAATWSWVVDTVPVTVRIDSHPTDPTLTADPTTGISTFVFSASKANVTFACAIDASAPSPCLSPQAYKGLSYGNHSFVVSAKDPAGNTAMMPFRWTIATSLTCGVTVTANPSSLPADGKSASSVTVTVTSSNCSPANPDTVNMTVTPNTCGSIAPRSAATNAQGQASFVYIASTIPATCTVTATEANTGTSGSVTIAQTPSPIAMISPSSVDWTANPPPPNPVTITLTDSGGGLLIVNAVRLTSNSDPGFTIQTDNCSGKQLAGGASCSVQVHSQFGGNVDASGVLQFFDNAPGSPQGVSLRNHFIL
jgi:hypothetical protein